MNLQETKLLPEPLTSSEQERISRYDWITIASDLSNYGAAVLEKLLTRKECEGIAALYPKEEHFRSHIIMARHGFGKGEYQYFKYPLPGLVNGYAPRCTPAWRRSLTIGMRGWGTKRVMPQNMLSS
jgi:hypothetical protein